MIAARFPIPASPPPPEAPAVTPLSGGRGVHTFVNGRYVSPIPAQIVMDYRDRARGPFEQRIHMFPKPDGGATWCDPASCRECWREEHLRAPATGAGDAP